METFQHKNGYKRIFKENKLTLGLFIPIESYSGDTPTMENHIQMAQKADELGFGALWVRDIPLHDPYFGDVGQIYDPWVYLGLLSAYTEKNHTRNWKYYLSTKTPNPFGKSSSIC